jgi:uncharacterized protein (DUF1684 family)
MISRTLTLLVLVIAISSCTEYKKENRLDDDYTNKLKQERENKDWEMKYDQHSPFKVDTSARYAPLKYFESSAEFIFKSILFRYNDQDTVSVFGTKGEERKAIKTGYVILNYNGKKYNLNIYKSFSREGQEYYSIWFTDQTTGKESYHVGRYIDFEIDPNPGFEYTIDFNRAYNPYCAYSDKFTCPIPRKEDHLDFEIRAGEKNFHE